jgi:hypothetical protein
MRSRFPPYNYLTRILEACPDNVPVYYQLWCNHYELDEVQKIRFCLSDSFYYFDLMNTDFEDCLDDLEELGLLVWKINHEDETYEIYLVEPHASGEGRTLS